MLEVGLFCLTRLGVPFALLGALAYYLDKKYKTIKFKDED